MKAYIIQPYYSFEEKDLDTCYQGMIDLLNTVKEDADIIILPEYADVPAACESKVAFHNSIARYNATIKEQAAAAARRCHAIVFFNAADETPTGCRNTTYALDREGNVVRRYGPTSAPAEFEADIAALI